VNDLPMSRIGHDCLTGIGFHIGLARLRLASAGAALFDKKSMRFTKRWRKWRDAPLAAFLTYKLRRRARAGMEDPTAVDECIERIRRHVR
jgi:hypothetical protein